MDSTSLLTAAPTDASTSETAESLFARLRHFYSEGRVAMELDAKRLMHLDSPVHYEAEGNQWVYPLLLLTGAVWWKFGWQIGGAVAFLSMVLYYTVAKRILRQRIERRVRKEVFNDLERWRKLWNFGGVTLTNVAGDGTGGVCASPKGNWMDFTRRLGRP